MMRVAIYASMAKPKEREWAEALHAGLLVHQTFAYLYDTAEQDPEHFATAGVDIAIAFGVKAAKIFRQCQKAGQRTIMFDKAYVRVDGAGADHFRVMFDVPGKPLIPVLREPRPSTRWDRLRITVQPRRRVGSAVIFAGSSDKYHQLHGLPHPTTYAQMAIAEIRRRMPAGTEIIYRPKPSWQGFNEIEGTTLSRQKGDLRRLLARASVLVTHGSSAAIDAIVSGVPALTLGPNPAWPVSRNNLNMVDQPYYPEGSILTKWLNGLAYWQWTLDELRSGEAWDFIRRELEETAP